MHYKYPQKKYSPSQALVLQSQETTRKTVHSLRSHNKRKTGAIPKP